VQYFRGPNQRHDVLRQPDTVRTVAAIYSCLLGAVKADRPASATARSSRSWFSTLWPFVETLGVEGNSLAHVAVSPIAIRAFALWRVVAEFGEQRHSQLVQGTSNATVGPHRQGIGALQAERAGLDVTALLWF
jgi:hypothetical protein